MMLTVPDAIDNITPKISTLKNLRALQLNSNKLEILPQEIGELDKLETLSLDNNPLKSLSLRILASLKQLKTLEVSSNLPLWSEKRIPQEVVDNKVSIESIDIMLTITDALDVCT